LYVAAATQISVGIEDFRMLSHVRFVSSTLTRWLVVLLAVSVCGCSSSTSTAPATSGGSGVKPTGSTGGAATKRLILLTNGNSPFWDAARAGLQDAETKLELAGAGFTAVMEVNDGTPQGQLDKLRQYGSQSDIAAVAVSAIDANNVAIAAEMKKLSAKGVPVITVDSDLDREKLRDARFAFIGTDNLAGGRELGVCAKHLRANGGEYVTFVGRTGAQNAIERVGGFGEGAGAKFKSLDNMGDDLDRTKARDNVRNAIRNHPGLNTLVGIWSYNAPAIVDVVKELGKRDAMTVVVFDAEPLAIEQMADGKIDAMVVQNPYQMGFQGVKLMKALVTNDDATVKGMFPKLDDKDAADRDIYDTGLKVVVPDDKSPLKKEMFSDKTEYLLLDAFREWLKKYNLTGS
jgi:ribose transport system substrate-binding protein